MSFLRYRVVNIISGLVFTAIFFVYGCGKEVKEKSARQENRPKNEEILARIGDKVITSNEYREEITMLPANYKGIANLHKDQFLESLISKHLLLQEAKRKNLQNNEDVKKLFKRAKEEIMIQELINREITNIAEVSDSEIEEYYHENQNDYTEPAKIRASHILVDSEVVAIKILEDLKRGADFAELAKEYSLDIPTKDKGGELGYFAKGAFIAEFEQACEALKVNEISEPVKTDLGYHIIKIVDKKEAGPKTLEEVKDEIKNKLLLDKQMALYENLLQNLKKKYEISVNKELLETITLTP